MEKFQRVEYPEDPRRCQKVLRRSGQCVMVAVDGEKFCYAHINNQLTARRKRAVAQYRLHQYQERLKEFSDSDQIKSLREEIGILRLTLETVLNRCMSPNDILLQSNRISDLAVKIQKLVESTQRLELSTGFLMDKVALERVLQTVIGICERRILDETTKRLVADDIIEVLATKVENEQQTLPAIS